MDPSLDPLALIAGGLCVLFAAVMRGYTGFGFAIAGVPLLSLFFAPAAIVPLAMILQVLAGIDGTVRDRDKVVWPTLGLLTIAAVIFLWVGVAVLSVLEVRYARIAVSLGVTGTVLLLASGFRLSAPPKAPLVALTGALSGFLGGLLAMPGPPAIALMMAGPHSNAAIRATLIAFFTVTGAIGAVFALQKGMIETQWLGFYAAMVPIMLGGARLGRWLFHTALGEHYRKIGLILLIAVAITSWIKTLGDWI
ncbi:MAG: sulfite exporter TauE/SafE family protein [Rhodospirillaceae bacterium]